jgi:hypothetical protein
MPSKVDATKLWKMSQFSIASKLLLTVGLICEGGSKDWGVADLMCVQDHMHEVEPCLQLVALLI